jgi:hypothetical protein
MVISGKSLEIGAANGTREFLWVAILEPAVCQQEGEVPSSVEG